MMIYYSNPVTKRYRAGRREPERTCRCEAVPWPHRVGSVEGCCGDAYCSHGLPIPGHPDYEQRCPDCNRDEYGDFLFDCWRDEGLC